MKEYIKWFGAAAVICILIGFALLWYIQQNIIVRLPNGFYPEIIHIEENESISFINMTLSPSWPAAGPHPTHTTYPDFDPNKGIPPGHTWTFTFAKEGTFTFHDHYSPLMKGIVVSGSTDLSQVTNQDNCDTLIDKQQHASCIEIYFRNIAKNEEYPKARSVYKNLAVRYPNSCHSFAHDLGENAYMSYLKDTLPTIGQEASSCAYGLWHGFTTAMQADIGFIASKEFCSSLTGETEELLQVNRMNCYHGIGIGLISDPPPSNLWGKFKPLVDPALSFCDTIPGNILYKERCLTGVFHAMTLYMRNNLYDFTFDENSLTNCDIMKSEYQYACFITLVSAVPIFTNFDLERTVAIIQRSQPSQDIFNEVFLNAAIMSVFPEDQVEEMGRFVEKCDELNTDFRSLCITAVLNHLYSNNSPGTEYHKAVAFCSGVWIQNAEQVSCFRQAISNAARMYTPEKLTKVCSIIPSVHHSNIPEC
jgi:hypothetical protein